MAELVSGFSKLTKEEKIEWIAFNFLKENTNAREILSLYWNSDEQLQQLHDDFIENTISNYYMPFGVAPNFVINGRLYTIPMAIEESSVVAAASLVAKFWSDKGGFKTEVINTVKVGQVHFMYEGNTSDLQSYFKFKKEDLIAATQDITKNMRKRGGGILNIELRDKTDDLENYYQLHVTFETKDSMGANFINSCLEVMAEEFKKDDIQIVMSILSNYVPNCLVKASVSCEVEKLHPTDGALFAKKMKQAVEIANVEPHRAVTHNKGVMNGIDAVVIATGNDFRAVEAGVHAYAAKSGTYKSLTSCKIEDGVFTFSIEIPLALGTVGGLTSTHPLSKLSLEMLHNPSAKELMQIVAVAGLAQNYAALRALTTTGIQEGHMKMHLVNILNQLEASAEEKEKVTVALKGQIVSYSGVAEVLEKIRA
ncbi:hydroxymethylglutaryl-CoA reductase, degradative [Wenyingzhuangia sp. 2_MG-2023]|uniref:hydroxymethylglutaryl-CoA reductase, degradative n=1 Tax=Wenyingzhuangia sp. 2_MG-2023 TaxID=3062639 RepID=UPI0026E41A74|nr:hydroxymethylglutaryl-CoA reductase, degradative [Wenyingzhuangia sp. 2_MG-2023]MDO6738240.1 hydroxymethylglutaryl-CoA reductase, degradative [Wenyingzhuangia sp. 2_MG-2023]